MGTATGIGRFGASGGIVAGTGGRSGLLGLGLYAIRLFSGEGNRVDNDRLDADAGE
jgi:hypothetical protein